MKLTLKQARIGCGLSQSDVAERLNINVSTYARYEKMPWLMSIESAEKVCDLYDCSFDDLIFLRSDVIV